MAPNAALKAAIFQSRKKQVDVAEQTRIHESRLSKIINGRLPPTAAEKAAIAAALGLAVHDLFPPREAA